MRIGPANGRAADWAHLDASATLDFGLQKSAGRDALPLHTFSVADYQDIDLIE
jgi:hypothetical protein